MAVLFSFRRALPRNFPDRSRARNRAGAGLVWRAVFPTLAEDSAVVWARGVAVGATGVARGERQRRQAFRLGAGGGDADAGVRGSADLGVVRSRASGRWLGGGVGAHRAALLARRDDAQLRHVESAARANVAALAVPPAATLRRIFADGAPVDVHGALVGLQCIRRRARSGRRAAVVFPPDDDARRAAARDRHDKRALDEPHVRCAGKTLLGALSVVRDHPRGAGCATAAPRAVLEPGHATGRDRATVADGPCGHTDERGETADGRVGALGDAGAADLAVGRAADAGEVGVLRALRSGEFHARRHRAATAHNGHAAVAPRGRRRAESRHDPVDERCADGIPAGAGAGTGEGDS